jgi:hypothetical protein
MALWFVIGFMTKFVAALFLPVILGVAALVKREDRGRLYRDWPAFVSAAALAIALIVPWFAYQYYARASEPGPRVFDVMFGAHVFQRFTATLDPAHAHPWTYYLSRFWSDLTANGTSLLVSVAALLFLARVWHRRWIEGAVIVLWFVIPLAAISAGTSKLYHYAYPFLAPAALAGGWLMAVVASRVYRWIAAPVHSLTSGRDSRLPGGLVQTRVQVGLTVAGLLSLIVAAVTAGFDRIHLMIGPIDFRNSSVARPATVTAATWLLGAPQHVWSAAIVGGLLLLALPLSAYHANIAQAKQPHKLVRLVRNCLAPVFDEQVALGRKRRGTWVETKDLSWIPFYYLRSFGQWREGGNDSTAIIARHLLSPDEPQLVLLSRDRYQEIIEQLVAGRAGILEQAARLTGVDPSVMETRLAQNPVGLVIIGANMLLLPGPYAACGHEQVRLIG